MKKHIPNVFTCLNLAIGAFGIFYVFTVGKEYAFYFVIACAVFDFFDGFAARLLNVKSDFGKELDSLADMVSFGLLPSFFIKVWLIDYTPVYWLALLIAVFSALRLAKFNLDEGQSNSFEGLPTPANAIMLTSLIYVGFELSEMTLISICLLSSLLLISKLRLLALKFSSWGFKGNEARWLLVFGAIILFIVFKWTFIPLLIPYYLVISIATNVLGLGTNAS